MIWKLIGADGADRQDARLAARRSLLQINSSIDRAAGGALIDDVSAGPRARDSGLDA